jgi:hypothetical protein
MINMLQLKNNIMKCEKVRTSRKGGVLVYEEDCKTIVPKVVIELANSKLKREDKHMRLNKL